MVADYFVQQGKTGLAKYQVQSVVRNYLGGELNVNNRDLDSLEVLIRKKEAGVPGSNSKAIVDRVKALNSRRSAEGSPKNAALITDRV